MGGAHDPYHRFYFFVLKVTIAQLLAGMVVLGAFRLITGREPDVGRMLAHFKTMTA
ncbi:hypothetical protein FHS26_000649 [Rhizobium pisi]|uniref:Uncharacterized protein n=1 Tax=Rhizobium pisi TaxID=574561 RepID=A0A7W5BHM0_9HYPH|nr:hypothetical protein [Rhizobium pisi]MBB3132946.1 hypothetical protein [Rhizobium pisi]